jgi:D-alanyl-D-alanine carboxypeptidase
MDAPIHDGSAVDSSEQLQAVVEEYLTDKTNILGTIVMVDIQGTSSYESASGFIDLSRTIPLEPDTQFAVGSVTKLFTAVLVHQLIERGQVQLHSPIMEYLSPEWLAVLQEIQYADEITVEQALSHRSGIADVTNSEAFLQSLYYDRAAAWRPLDILRMVVETGEVEFRPGANYDYSNTNYLLLGGVIENVSGLSYRQSLQNNILDRIGLQDTLLVGETFGSFDGTIARGYSKIDGEYHDGHGIKIEWAHAEGGIISTARDLITFYRALESGDLFDHPETYPQMSQLVGHNEAYGRGMEVIEDPDIGLHHGHRGNFMGTRSIVAHFPEQRMTIAICHTYLGFSLSHPADLMKRVVRAIRGDAPPMHADPQFEGPEILADSANLIAIQDEPTHGEWDFALKEEWSLGRLGPHPLGVVGDIHVDDEGYLYLLDRGTATITVLDAEGDPLRSFGGRGDGPLFEYPVRLFVTPGRLHVLDLGRHGDRIKTYDKSGRHVETFALEKGVSPRLFIDDDTYLAVRTGSDVLNRPTHELLEILPLSGSTISVLAKFPAEEKLILEAMVPRGRYILLQDDINIFPRLVVHFDGEMLYLGRSDRYVIKKIDQSGREHLALSITGREKKRLPDGFAIDLAARTTVAGKEMTAETRDRFIPGVPDRQTFYTKITTDERGLIYVFTPDVTDFGTQEIDIFSPEGSYLYHAAVRLSDGSRRIRPLEIAGDHLYALVKNAEGGARLVAYGIKRPEGG